MPIDFDITIEKLEELYQMGFAFPADGDIKMFHVEVDESDGNGK